MSISDNFQWVRSKIPEHVTLVAVSKTKANEEIMEVYRAGQRDFAENKVQELIEKQQILPKDIQWHLIGHLQTNKVKYIVPFIHLIHSIDSLKLLKEINKEAIKCNRTIDCLIQLHIAQEETKFGFSEEELNALLSSEDLKSLSNIRVCGLMGMATYTSDEIIIKKEFQKLKTIFCQLENSYLKDVESFKILSMGMSSDFELAIGCGSNLVRVGSLIFGERDYGNF
jgi:PLP dependent protein